MAIVTLNPNDSGATSRVVINDNFTDVTASLALKANLASPTFTGTVTTPAIKITTGAGANKVLISDADGDATWTTSTNQTSFSTTEVFNGTSPTSFTDLDLSSVIGATQKVVLLKFITSGGNVVVGVKTNGDADTYGTNSGFGGISSMLITTSEAATTIVKTDTSGVIEWKAGSGQAFTVDVLAYW
jgi:hypothetical protein